MTLQSERDRRRRPPMSKRTLWIIVGAIVVIFAFIGIVLAVSGQSFF